MRGKEEVASSTESETGITPAYAGKSFFLLYSLSSLWDHPRVCGEKCLPAYMILSGIGSPPRMRGKGTRDFGLFVLNGITPAYAGKSSPDCSFSNSAWDHPRVCGEKPFQLNENAHRQGSPPRMRGKAGRMGASLASRRITPAYAGKSESLCDFGLVPVDHPRVCGEKTKKIPSHRPFQLHPVPVSFSFA